MLPVDNTYGGWPMSGESIMRHLPLHPTSLIPIDSHLLLLHRLITLESLFSPLLLARLIWTLALIVVFTGEIDIMEARGNGPTYVKE